MFVGRLVGLLAVLLVAPAAAETPASDADRGWGPARSNGRGLTAGGRGAGGDGAAAGPTAARDGWRPNPRGLLVPAGETIRDIDTIIEALDRQAPVSAIAFSPDGALIASGSEDHMVRVWQPASGRLVRRLEGHASAVTAVAFSPDGSVIASASNDRTVRLWEARSGRLLRTLQGHVYHVYAIAFDPHRSWLATASWDRTIQLWDAKSGELVKKLRGHGAAIRAIDFSRDGVAGLRIRRQTVRLWSVDTGKELKVLAGHAGPVNAVRFRPDGEWLFSGSADHSVRTWRVPDGAVLRKLGDCGAPVLALAVSRNGQMLGGACGDGGAVLWDIATGTELRRVATVMGPRRGRSPSVPMVGWWRPEATMPPSSSRTSPQDGCSYRCPPTWRTYRRWPSARMAACWRRLRVTGECSSGRTRAITRS
jgi:WD40 repeat protein